MLGDSARAPRAAAPRADSRPRGAGRRSAPDGIGAPSRPPSSSRSSALPALRPRRRAAVDGDRALERRPLRRDGARVVARVGLLLVGRSRAPRRRRSGPGRGTGAKTAERAPTTTRRLARDDPLALVAPLGLGQARVQDGDAVAEARPEAAEGLRRERDLRDEHDRAAPALERGRAGLEVDLGLAAAGRAGEQQVAAAGVERARRCARRARCCGSVSCAGSASPASASRTPASRRSPRRLRCFGATSASARAGVEP